MGVGYKGGATTYHSIDDNVESIKSSYPLNNKGFFGTNGKSSDEAVRNIASTNPEESAKDFYDKIAYGGKEDDIVDKKTGAAIGKKTTLKDGSIISWRKVSSSDGSPAVDINISKNGDSSGISAQKIHFVQEDKK